MSKTAAVWRCNSCGATAPRWIGRCAECGEFDTYTEETTHREPRSGSRWVFSSEVPKPLSEIQSTPGERWSTGINELDRVLGGGLVPGSLILLGGEPGVGKSTLTLQAAGSLAASGKTVLVVTGEESPEQVKLRADRLGGFSDKLFLLAEISLERIEAAVATLRPDVLVVDSIQTLFHPAVESAPGSVSQVRECAAQLLRWGKTAGVPVLLIGHVTKDGTIAGPRVLEHMVDTVLYFDGGDQHTYRLVRTVKNRYGPSNELAVFSMGKTGLTEVANPSELFLSQRSDAVSGSAVAAVVEGTRPLMVELQALVTPSYLTNPRRLTTGVEHNRAMITLAVLEKRAGIRLAEADVYINVVGGVKIFEPALDLPLAMAVVSAAEDRLVPRDICAFGEIGLTGEVRPVGRVSERLKEAAKLGFKQALVPKSGSIEADGLEIIEVANIGEALTVLRSER